MTDVKSVYIFFTFKYLIPYNKYSEFVQIHLLIVADKHSQIYLDITIEEKMAGILQK